MRTSTALIVVVILLATLVPATCAPVRTNDARWVGLSHRTANPLFTELLTDKPGNYHVVAWPTNMGYSKLPAQFKAQFSDPTSWNDEVEKIYRDSAAMGLGYLDLPTSLTGFSSPRLTALRRELNRRYGVKYGVWTEGNVTAAVALKNGAEVINPVAAASGAKKVVSLVDPVYLKVVEKDLADLGAQFRDTPYVGVFMGKDEPYVALPDSSPDKWGPISRQNAKEVISEYGYGKFTAPFPSDAVSDNDPKTPLRWIAFNRWAANKWYQTRLEFYKTLHTADPDAVYSPADYWFMTGFRPFDYPRLASCTDMFEIDPYASSAERRTGRGVYNHGFGPKFISDLTGKPVRVIVQAFDYAGYKVQPEDLREWVSQAVRCGASAISYYQMDNPQWTAPERWKMMLYLSKIVSSMPRIALPNNPDTAILYASYTHMSQGAFTGGDQVYAAHALIGELAGSWYRFVADSQVENGERDLSSYKAVYLPLGRYMTPEATAKIEAYVRGGGVLVCGDAEAFASDLEGNDTTATGEKILGIQVTGPKAADRLILTKAPGGGGSASLPLYNVDLWGEKSRGRARQIRLVDKQAQVIGTYTDGTPAVVVHRLGDGKVITFAANPFAPDIAVEKTEWPAVFKALQKSFGCDVDRPIWRFKIPTPQAMQSLPDMKSRVQ